jgi:hypothetical protein
MYPRIPYEPVDNLSGTADLDHFLTDGSRVLLTRGKVVGASSSPFTSVYFERNSKGRYRLLSDPVCTEKKQPVNRLVVKIK